jgi:hypothetical protein
MDTNRTPLLVGLFLNSYEVDFVHGLLKKNEKKLSRSFSFKYFTFLYIDVVLSLNNFKFSDFVDRFLICWICIYTGNETACRIFVWYPNYIKWTEIANKYFFLKVVFPMSPDFVTQTDDIPNCNWYLLTSHIDNHGSRSVCKAFTFATKVYSLYEQFSPNKELSWSCNLKRLVKISAKTISRAYSKTACVYLLPAGMETTSASRVYEGGVQSVHRSKSRRAQKGSVNLWRVRFIAFLFTWIERNDCAGYEWTIANFFVSSIQWLWIFFHRYM